MFSRRGTAKRVEEEPDTDEDDHAGGIDPDLRLRTVRTASSAIAESIRSENRMRVRRTKRRKLWGTKSSKKPPSNAGHDLETPPEEEDQQGHVIPAEPKGAKGSRRNIYVNVPLGAGDSHRGEPIHRYVRNKVRTTSKPRSPRSQTS